MVVWGAAGPSAPAMPALVAIVDLGQDARYFGNQRAAMNRRIDWLGIAGYGSLVVAGLALIALFLS